MQILGRPMASRGLRALADQEALECVIAVANVVQNQIPRKRRQVGGIERAMNCLIQKVGQAPTQRIVLCLVCFELRIPGLTENPFLRIKVLVSQGRQVVQQREKVACRQRTFGCEQLAANEQKPFMLGIQYSVTNAKRRRPGGIDKHGLNG